jgi:hypothetical protein
MRNNPRQPADAGESFEGTVQDEAEAARWFEEGRTEQWVCEEYERRYNITTTPSLWVSFRQARGLTRRIAAEQFEIPWLVAQEHRSAYPLAMLRLELRRRAGGAMTDRDRMRLESWTVNLAGGDLVAAYDRRTTEGFSYVPRRPGIDRGPVRRPDDVPGTSA